MSGSTVAPQAATAQLLDDAAQRAARLLAMELQARVRAAHARLADAADGEALHDFRVAVRRLRSWLDIEAVLPGKLVPARVRKLLRSLAKASNARRDDEVLAEWLATRRAASAAQHDDAVDWLLARIEDPGQGDAGGLHAELDRDFGKAMASLDEHLPWYSVRRHVHRGEQGETFAASLAALLRLDVGRLQRRLAAVHASGDDKAIHRARIAVKRLRYHLEPVADALTGAPHALDRLRILQDLLGDHHDGLVWMGIVRSFEAQAPNEGIRHGLGRIVARIERRRQRRLASLKDEWLGNLPQAPS